MKTRRQYIIPYTRLRPLTIEAPLMTSGPSGGDGGGTTPGFVMEDDFNNGDDSPGIKSHSVWEEEDESADEE